MPLHNPKKYQEIWRDSREQNQTINSIWLLFASVETKLYTFHTEETINSTAFSLFLNQDILVFTFMKIIIDDTTNFSLFLFYFLKQTIIAVYLSSVNSMWLGNALYSIRSLTASRWPLLQDQCRAVIPWNKQNNM